MPNEITVAADGGDISVAYFCLRQGRYVFASVRPFVCP